jgi:hypothetical protein
VRMGRCQPAGRPRAATRVAIRRASAESPMGLPSNGVGWDSNPRPRDYECPAPGFTTLRTTTFPQFKALSGPQRSWVNDPELRTETKAQYSWHLFVNMTKSSGATAYDDDALGAADVTQPIAVLVLLQLAKRVHRRGCAGGQGRPQAITRTALGLTRQSKPRRYTYDLDSPSAQGAGRDGPRASSVLAIEHSPGG